MKQHFDYPLASTTAKLADADQGFSGKMHAVSLIPQIFPATGARNLARAAGAWLMVGVGFNITQRVMDYLLDSGFKSVGWLAWLAN